MPKNPIAGEGFLQALPHEMALQFPGAADYAFAKNFFVEHGITALQPCQEILTQYGDLIRALFHRALRASGRRKRPYALWLYPICS